MMEGPRRTPFPRVVAFFRRHPVWLFLAFTPGIPEYLSGSTSTAALLYAPGGFLLFLALNLGLYGPGALLAREAFVRWKPGWAGVILLGAAYGLLEEGTALSTLFNPQASVVGAQGYYGHFSGVNWVWAVGVLGVHIVYSVGLPILLLGLALPETRGRPLLSERQIPIALVIYAGDIGVLVFATHYWQTAPGLLLGAALLAAILYAVTHRLPHGALDPGAERPRLPFWTFFLMGLAFYPILLLVPGLGNAFSVWPPATMAIEILLAGALFLFVRREIGRVGNEAALTVLALGALLPLFATGLLFQLRLPVELVVDVLFVLFFYALWKRYGPGLPQPPLGAT
ncbi:MAG TPA: hypothetical protein VK423_06110 [Thermoplasmata archaeon]|nr:hypothetical protein [Thermoplasmata archaeon]